MKKIFLVLLISLIVLTGCESKKEENLTKIVENNKMIGYTIDGEKTDIKPSKEEGYIVNKIICDNGSDMMWDNDNWEVEFTKVNSKDRCKLDFTKDTSKEGYRVTVTSNMPSAIDSLSKATTENGTVIIYSKSKIENITGCNGIIEDNKLIISNVNSIQTCNINIEDKTLAGIIKRAYPSQGARSNFSSAYTTTALHTAIDYDSDGSFNGTTYYFTGNPNNWVSFAGKLWRIIRINGDGSIRLLYAGTGEEDGYLTDVGATTYSIDSSIYNNPAYVGWKYSTSGTNGRGTSASSGVYNKVKSWYDTNIGVASKTDGNTPSKKLSEYIETNALYCNDRTASTSSANNTSYWTFIASNNLGTIYYYGGYKRLYNKGTPKLECNTSDQFKDGYGLMTVDEIVLAGGLWATNNSSAYYYLNASGGSSTGSNFWWTMSPIYWSGGVAQVFFVGGSSDPGCLGNVPVNYSSVVVRPVISLKFNVLVTGGDGSAENPYELTI